MKYIVREYVESNPVETVVKFGIYDSSCNDNRFCSDYHNGLIFLFDNEYNARQVCKYLNRDYYEKGGF